MTVKELFENLMRACVSRPAEIIRNRRRRVGKNSPAIVGLPVRCFVRPADRKAWCFEPEIIEFCPENATIDITLRPVYFSGKAPRGILPGGAK